MSDHTITDAAHRLNDLASQLDFLASAVGALKSMELEHEGLALMLVRIGADLSDSALTLTETPSGTHKKAAKSEGGTGVKTCQ